jgi:hypothetical protein
MYKKYLKNLLAISFSLFLMILIFSLLELFFYLNIKYKFLEDFDRHCKACIPTQANSNELITEMNLNFISKLEENKSPYSSFLLRSSIKYSRKTILKNSDIYIYKEILYSKKDNTILNETIVTMDHFNNRKTFPENKGAKKNLVFLGCSYTFGQGVSDSKTFPSILAKNLKNYRVHNLGTQGDGPHDTLSYFVGNNIKLKNINNAEIVFYTYIHDHFIRLLGSVEYFRRDVNEADRPYFTTTSEGPKLKGSFKTGRPVTTFLYLLLGKSLTLDYFNIDFPLINKEKIKFLADIFYEIKKESQLKFNSKKFFLIIYPGESNHIKSLLKELKTLNIDYLDYSNVNLNNILKGNHLLEKDSHPSELAYEFFAKLLLLDLKKRNLVK